MTNIKRVKSKTVYQLKISLNHIRPAIWRRFIVDADIKLPDLHNVIQTVMGWTNSHLHQFRIENQSYSSPYEDDLTEYIDYRRIRLNEVVTEEKQRFYYDYDFGDSWEHTVIVEKIMPKDKNVKCPVCVKGARNCPPEDCGGVYGYENLLKIIKDPKNEEYEKMMDWLGDEYDPEEFDVEYINKMLGEE